MMKHIFIIVQGVPINIWELRDECKIVFIRISLALPNFNNQNKVTSVKYIKCKWYKAVL